MIPAIRGPKDALAGAGEKIRPNYGEGLDYWSYRKERFTPWQVPYHMPAGAAIRGSEEAFQSTDEEALPNSFEACYGPLLG